jgi:plasmid stabilization system protein ParE
MVKVVWTSSALEDLDNIGEFIGKDSLKYALITVE